MIPRVQWFLFVVLHLLFATSSGDASTIKMVQFGGMRLKATSQSIFWLQERLQAPGFVDLGNMTFSVVPFDDHHDNGGERRLVVDSIEKEDSDGSSASRRKTRKRDKSKQKTIIYAPEEDPVLVDPQPQLTQQVIEAALVPIPKHCGTNHRLWDTMKLPSTSAGPKKQQQQQACDWKNLGIGVTIQSSLVQGSSQSSNAGTIHHFCCSQITIDKGICNSNQLGRLILNPRLSEGNYWEVEVPAAEDGASFSWSDNNSTEGIIFEINQTGDYLWILANCWDDGADVLVDGTLVWNSSFANDGTTNGNPKTGLGNLVHSIKEGPQSKKPTFPEGGLLQIWVFGAMGTLYLMWGICWCCCCRRCRHSYSTKTTSSLDITRQYVFSAALFVSSLYLGLSSVDLYVWGARSGSLDFWVWDGPERDEILRHFALVLGAFKAGMTRWLALVHILLVQTRALYDISPGTENQRTAQRRTRLRVSLLTIIYTIICIAWGIEAAIAKDNLHNMKMFMDGEEKRLLKTTVIISASAYFLDAWAYIWALFRFMPRCCRLQQYRQPNAYSSWMILVLVTFCEIFMIYTMGDLLKRKHKMDALFVWDGGNIRILTEATYFLVLGCLQSQSSSKRLSLPPDETCNLDNESDSYESNANGIVCEETSAEVEMAPLIP